MGDATHLATIPISGMQEHEGDILIYDGQFIEFTDELARALAELTKHYQDIQLLFMQQSIKANMARGKHWVAIRSSIFFFLRYPMNMT